MKLKQLVSELQGVATWRQPKYELEQYATPPDIVAHMLLAADEQAAAHNSIVDHLVHTEWRRARVRWSCRAVRSAQCLQCAALPRALAPPDGKAPALAPHAGRPGGRAGRRPGLRRRSSGHRRGDPRRGPRDRRRHRSRRSRRRREGDSCREFKPRWLEQLSVATCFPV